MFKNDDVTFGFWMHALEITWVEDERIYHHDHFLPGNNAYYSWAEGLQRDPDLFETACVEAILGHMHTNRQDTADVLAEFHRQCVALNLTKAPPVEMMRSRMNSRRFVLEKRT